MNKLNVFLRIPLVTLFFGCSTVPGTVDTEETVPGPGKIPVETRGLSSRFQGDPRPVLSLLASSTERILAQEMPVFLHVDHVENVTLITDEVGAVFAQQQAFEPYGMERGPPTRSTRYGFSGQEVDRSTGFTHYRYREFDPLRGSWVSVDPAFSISTPKKLGSHLGESTQGYTYIGNHANNGTDPNGLSKLGKTLTNIGGKIKTGLKTHLGSKSKPAVGALAESTGSLLRRPNQAGRDPNLYEDSAQTGEARAELKMAQQIQDSFDLPVLGSKPTKGLSSSSTNIGMFEEMRAPPGVAPAPTAIEALRTSYYVPTSGNENNSMPVPRSYKKHKSPPDSIKQMYPTQSRNR